MYITDHARSLVLSALIAYTSARQMVENLSFGHKETLSEDYRSIPGWKIFGDGHVPHLMSDRVILTPPYPGNQKGALWAESPAQSPGWFTDFYFRTSGPDRGGGSLHLWYTKDSQVQSPPIASLYTVRQFDGLVIVIDQYGGGGGSVRAFLNDGTTTFNTHPNLDSLAFGRCEYSYRNLGRLSRLRVTQTASYFQVEVDDRDCFRTEKVKLPAGYYFGISAITSDVPDSFEIHKFLLSDDEAVIARMDKVNGRSGRGASVQGSADGVGRMTGSAQAPKNQQLGAEVVDQIKNSQTALEASLRELKEIVRTSEESQRTRLAEIQSKVGNLERLSSDLDRKLQAVDGVVRKIQDDVEGRDYKEILGNLHLAMRESHSNLLQTLPESVDHIVTRSVPRMGLFLFAIIAFQLILAGSYVTYKRRRNASAKKYL